MSPPRQMSPEEFRAAAHQTVDWIADYLRDIRQYPVTPHVEPGELTARLPAQGPEHGEPIENILEDFRTLIVPGVTHWNHPRFFGYFSNSASGPGILGGNVRRRAECQSHVVEDRAIGHGAGAGLARLAAPMAGPSRGVLRHHSRHRFDRRNARGHRSTGGGRPARHDEMVLYTSEHANLSVDRGALGAGIGRANIRHIPIDDEFPDASGRPRRCHRSRSGRREKAVLRGAHVWVPPRRRASTRSRRSPRSPAATVSGCTSTQRMPVLPPCWRNIGTSSTARSWPIRWW